MRIRRFDATRRELFFMPPTDMIPDGEMLEILPFSPTEFVNAAKVAAQQLFDNGMLVRPYWTRIVGESPMYNADFSVWKNGLPDGWDVSGSGRVTQETNSINVGHSENSVRLEGQTELFLAEQWQRFLPAYYEEEEIDLRCWVRGSGELGVGWRLTSGPALTEPIMYTGNGEWQYLESTIIVPKTAPKMEPVLFSGAGANGYFNMPFVQSDGQRVWRYPFPSLSLPGGPLQITGAYFNSENNDVRQSLYLYSQIVVQQPRVLSYQHAGTDDKYGILDWSLNRKIPFRGEMLQIRTDAPLSTPNHPTDTTIIEASDNEALLFASVAAKHLLQRASAGRSPAAVAPYVNRLRELDDQITQLGFGQGKPRNVATYGIGW